MPFNNNIEYAEVFQSALDEQLIAESTSGWMEANAGQVKYEGGAGVKIPRVVMDGLGDYDRNIGYAPGSITLTYQPETLTQDRGRSFLIDKMDVDETNFVLTAGAVMGEFQRSQVVPEVDAYRYSKIAALAIADGKSTTYTPAEATILQQLNNDLYAIWDVVGEATPLVISMSSLAAKILNQSDKLQRQLIVSDFKQGTVSNKVKTYNDAPIINVPSARMFTSYVFRDGKTAGQTQGGFVKATTAQAIFSQLCVQRADAQRATLKTLRVFRVTQLDYNRKIRPHSRIQNRRPSNIRPRYNARRARLAHRIPQVPRPMDTR